MADNRNTLTDEILVLAETLGDIKARFERVESEFAIQSRPLEAALAALSAAMTGIKTLQHHVLDNSLSALSLKVEEQRKAIDDQINVIVGELKGADAQNDEKIALQTAELKQQFAEICANVQQLSSQFDAQIKRVELEAKEQITKFAAVTGPQGPAGASLNPKGNWQEGVFYQRLDVVSLLGTSYVSNVDNNASKPTKNSDKWTVLAARAGNVGGGGAANFGSIAGVAEINQGGTGQTTALLGARALLDGISTTTGDILYRGSSGWTSLTAGAADTVLKSQGSGAAPQWAATSSATAATDAQAAAGTSTTTFVTPANAKYAAAPVVNARAPRQGLVFDGTDDATLSGPTLGLNDFTISFVSSLPSVSGIQSIVSGISGPLIQNNAGALTFYKQGGSLLAYIAGVFEAGKSALITLTRSGTSVIVYKNGIQFSTATLPSNTDFSGSVAFFGSADGTNEKLTGTVTSPLIYNRALSSSEVVALYEAGAPAGSDYASGGANNTSFITGDNSTFASDTGYWTKANSATIGSGQCTLPTGGGAIYRAGLLAKGTKYRLSVNIITNQTTGLYVQNMADVGYGYITGTGVKTFEFTASGTGYAAFGLQNNLGAGSIVIDDVTLVPIGLLLAPDAYQAGNGLVWTDMSGNGAQIVLPTSGVSWNVPGTGQTRIRGTTSTNGNQQLLGASTYLGNTHITRMRARSRTGTPTITIGASSGTSGYVSSTALNQYWQNLTIANNLPASPGAIWIGSNSTDVVEVDCDIEPLSF